MIKVELTPEVPTPVFGLALAATLLLAGHAAGGRDLAILSLYAWLAGQQ